MRRDYMSEDEGDVIRSVDCFSGHVLYKEKVVGTQKDSIRMKDTFTIKGAKVTLSNFERKYKDRFFSIEKLSCYYFPRQNMLLKKTGKGMTC